MLGYSAECLLGTPEVILMMFFYQMKFCSLIVVLVFLPTDDDPVSSLGGERSVVKVFFSYFVRMVVLEMDFVSDILQPFLVSQGWEYDVFICHAGPDRAFIAMLQAKMLKCGLKSFVDIKSLEMGSGVQNTVAHAIVKSPFFVVFLSNSFQNSLHPESEAEAALAFAIVHKKIIPIFYQMSVCGCLQTDNELYHKLAAIVGFHKGYGTDEQFAESISQEVKQMAVEQLQSSKLRAIILYKNACLLHTCCLVTL